MSKHRQFRVISEKHFSDANDAQEENSHKFRIIKNYQRREIETVVRRLLEETRIAFVCDYEKIILNE